MKKSRKPQKGVRYVANALRKYLPGQYKSYNSALPKAREITEQLKKSKTPVKLESILPLAKTTKSRKREKPEIDPKLLESSYYFQLVDYPLYILRSSDEIYFKSKLFPKGIEEIKGGDNPDYNQYFAPFVNYINSVKAQTDPEDKLYETQWLVNCTEPTYNRSKKRWESEIISTDQSGDRFDYGFDPRSPLEKSKSAVVSQKEQKAGAVEPQKEDVSADAKKTGEISKSKEIIELETRKLQFEVEQKKQENISNALKLFGEGLITKQEFKEIMSQIKR